MHEDITNPIFNLTAGGGENTMMQMRRMDHLTEDEKIRTLQSAYIDPFSEIF